MGRSTVERTCLTVAVNSCQNAQGGPKNPVGHHRRGTSHSTVFQRRQSIPFRQWRGVRVGEASNPGPNRLRRAGSSVGSRVLSTRPTVVDSESDADDERLPVGAVPEDVILALESDLCSESSVVVGDC